MVETRWLLGVVCCLAACATGTSSRLRDIDGNPLPAYAFEDAAGPVYKVQCADGNSYLVVTNPPPFLTGPNQGTVLRFRQRDMTEICVRILASRL